LGLGYYDHGVLPTSTSCTSATFPTFPTSPTSLENITIRHAVAADVPAILPMVEAICDLHLRWDPDKYGFLPDIKARYENWLPERAADPMSVFLVGETSSPASPQLVGFIVGSTEEEIPIYRVARYGFIHDTWVQPEFRSRGIARRLAAAAVEQFRAIGVPQVRLDTAAANEAARRVFGSLGFRVSASEMLLAL